MLLLATRERRTMTGRAETQFHAHVGSCASCAALASEIREDQAWRWLVRIPADALDASATLVLPMVDPVVFGAKTELASGGMGRITRVLDRRLGREVALKEVLDPDLRRRFEREVRITARLQHPAIVSIYEAGSFPDGSSFYTMPLVPGRTLQDAITAAHTLAERLLLMRHVRAVAEAVGYAHAHGVIHRDLKPSNVLVGEFGETVVIDWGLAKQRDDDNDDNDDHDAALATSGGVAASAAALTRAGSVIGTPCYMSPAQAAGDPVDATDDVYALGAILYHVLSGTPPYLDIAHDADALITATRDRPPTPLAELAPAAPADLRAIAERAMSRITAERFPTGKQLADELARFEAGQLLLSRAYTTRELLVRWLRRHRRAVAVAAAGVITAIGLAVMWTRYQHAADELAIRTRGAQLTDLYGDVARQGYHIDRDLLRLESALEGLAAAAAWALTGPEPSPELAPVYFDRDFADPARRPADFTNKTAYRWPVSVQYPVVGVAPGTDRTALLPNIRRLSPLRHHIREMVLQGANHDTTHTTPDEANALLLARTSPIDYAYVDLPEGVHVVWPGSAGLRADYDVRTASFYRMSANKRGSRWGAPYVDSTTDRRGDDLVLPCTKGIWSSAGTFLGVAGVEMTVTKMVDTSMTMRTRTMLRASLVDAHGRKVIDSRDANKRFVASGRDEAIEFVDFDLPDIAAAIRSGREGVLDAVRDGRPIVVAFVRLDAIGWYYVVEVDATSLGLR